METKGYEHSINQLPGLLSMLSPCEGYARERWTRTKEGQVCQCVIVRLSERFNLPYELTVEAFALLVPTYKIWLGSDISGARLKSQMAANVALGLFESESEHPRNYPWWKRVCELVDRGEAINPRALIARVENGSI